MKKEHLKNYYLTQCIEEMEKGAYVVIEVYSMYKKRYRLYKDNVMLGRLAKQAWNSLKVKYSLVYKNVENKEGTETRAYLKSKGGML